jgi:hypothetical protein
MAAATEVVPIKVACISAEAELPTSDFLGDSEISLGLLV